MVLSQELKKEADKLMAMYPDKGAALLPVLHLVQRELDYITPETEEQIAKLMGLTKTRVQGVLTFYTMYHTVPIGKYLVQVCKNISCTISGAERLIEYIKHKLGIGLGETTADGKFTLITVECLGSCGTSPAMQINDDYHESLTEKKIDEIFEQLK